MKKLLVLLLSLCCLATMVGCGEKEADINAKSEGVMTWAEYDAAAKDDEVVVECYVQGHQSWWNDKITVYAQDKDGGYLMYEMACSEEDAAKLVPGTKIKVTGTKAEWGGEIEIGSGCTFEIEEDTTYVADPIDVTGLSDDEMIKYMNMVVSFSNMTVEDYDGNGAGFGYKSAQGDDLYFSASANGVKVNFCIESYLTGSDTEVYQKVESLKAGDVIDVTGFLYWYNGANPHVTSVVIK